MPKHCIGITTTSFAEHSQKPIEALKAAGYEVRLNAKGRKLKSDELVVLLSDCLGVVAGTETYDAKVLEQLPSLKVISRVGTGVDGIDFDQCKKCGIEVCSTPDGPVRAVAELVIGLALNLLRHINEHDYYIRSGEWTKLMGHSIEGKAIGIFGLGRIGKKVAEFALALGAGKVCYFDPHVSDPIYTQCRNKEELLSTCDIISVHLPLDPTTKALISTEEFALMKKESILINCARGGVINEKALYEALKKRQISGAAVDVFENEPYKGPLSELDNIILTPHIGAYTAEARVKMEADAVANLLALLK